MMSPRGYGATALLYVSGLVGCSVTQDTTAPAPLMPLPKPFHGTVMGLDVEYYGHGAMDIWDRQSQENYIIIMDGRHARYVSRWNAESASDVEGRLIESHNLRNRTSRDTLALRNFDLRLDSILTAISEKQVRDSVDAVSK